MNKLYWIVCEEGEQTLFEGRYLGRTRGAAMKHLKEQLGRSNLTGLVFSVTEIPVPLIREIVAEILAGGGNAVPMAETRPAPEPEEPAGRYEAFAESAEAETDDAEADEPELPASMTSPQPLPEYDWAAIKACYMKGRGPKDVAELMNVPINTLKRRITREGWARERRGE